MPELSNLLRQKLGEAQNGGVTHPDADTLTALTEHLLPAAERQQVLAHLAACGQCREVVALSQPMLPELVAQPVTKAAPVAGWRKLFTPTFGLAATAAVMAIVAVVVLQSPQKQNQQPQPSSEAKVTQPANPTADAQSTTSTPAQPETVAPALNQVEPARSDRTNNEARTRTVPAPPPNAALTAETTATNRAARQPVGAAGQVVLDGNAGGNRRDFVNPGIIFAANSTDNYASSYNSFATNGNGLPAAPQPQPLASDARLTANNQLTIFKDLPPSAPGNKSDMHILKSSEPQDRFWNLGKIVQKGAHVVLRHTTPSVPAINGNALVFSAMGGPAISADLQKQQPAEVAAAPEKPANVDGLQRFEGLNRRAMAAADADSTAVLWKVLGGKLVKSSGPGQWEDAYPGAGFQFAIVTARGNEVWAGGTQASVIHSHDGGKTWEAAKLGDAASGTVMNILFSGNIVQVKTSEDQSWLSSDGGKSWAQN